MICGFCDSRLRLSGKARVVSHLLGVGELVHILSPASRPKQGIARLLDVFPLSIAEVEESFRMKLYAVCFVGVSASMQTQKGEFTIDSMVGVTARVEIAVRCPAVTDDRSTCFDPYIHIHIPQIPETVKNIQKHTRHINFNFVLPCIIV